MKLLRGRVFQFLCIFWAISLAQAETVTDYGRIRMVTRKAPTTLDPTRVIQISWQPRAFLYKKFLSSNECDHLINLAKDKMEKTQVTDDKTGIGVDSESRTSTGMFLAKAQDDVVDAIEDRLALLTLLPKENGESLQILRYGEGQKYEPHYDVFKDSENQRMGGQRVATVLMYLSNVEKGGETIFPNSRALQEKDETFSQCANRGYAVKPEKGDALFFFSLNPDTSPDPYSLHGSCPVIAGEKWSATKWIHVADFERLYKQECADAHENCAIWAFMGECQKSPEYMVGTDRIPGTCMRSCRVC